MDEKYLESWTWDERQAWLALVETHAHLFAVLDRELIDACGLDLQRYEVLAQLAEEPAGRLRMIDLAVRCGVTPGGLTRRFESLERDGHVSRARSSTDRREVVASITAKGRKLLDRASPIHQSGVDQHFLEVLEPDELRVLFKALSRVVDQMRDGSDVVQGDLDVPSSR